MFCDCVTRTSWQVTCIQLSAPPRPCSVTLGKSQFFWGPFLSICKMRQALNIPSFYSCVLSFQLKVMFITEKRAHIVRQANLKKFLTYIKAISNFYLWSRLVVLVIHLLLLLRKYTRRDEAAERFCNAVKMESKLRGAEQSSTSKWARKLQTPPFNGVAPTLSWFSPCIFFLLACPSPPFHLWTSFPFLSPFPPFVSQMIFRYLGQCENMHFPLHWEPLALRAWLWCSCLCKAYLLSGLLLCHSWKGFGNHLNHTPYF